MTDWTEHVGKGWREIVKQAIEKIEAKGGTITQVKEKFGGLRLYCQGKDREIYDIATEAENACESICENCGKEGKLRNNKSWLKTLCDDCDKPGVVWND